MTVVYQEDNVNEVFPQVLEHLSLQPLAPSRNGPVRRFLDPVVITYLRPTERILFSNTRDAHPIFHFFETLWMLNGQDDLKFLLPFNPRMREYSDDGVLVRGSAYGARWRNWFGYDQLKDIAEKLKADPYDRRCVITMWDAATDPRIQSKDIPCNLQCLFGYTPDIGGGPGFLNLSVTNRSNDCIYGSLGSNVFHFSFLLEFMAGLTGLKVGKYHQISNNLHIYTENPAAKRCLDNLDKIQHEAYDYVYPKGHYPIFTAGVEPNLWFNDLEFFLRTEGATDEWRYHHNFFPEVAKPLWEAHKVWKAVSDYPKTLEGLKARFGAAVAWASTCSDIPLSIAACEWLERRYAGAKVKYNV